MRVVVLPFRISYKNINHLKRPHRCEAFFYTSNPRGKALRICYNKYIYGLKEERNGKRIFV